ncbi:MAG: acyl-CoA dehydrogenase [Acidimicrobiia bacterium]
MNRDLTDYLTAAEAWLVSQLPRRDTARDLRWGEGSDDVAILKNHSFEEERARIDAIREWQRTKSDAGYGSIAWPVELGGAGLGHDHALAFLELEAQFETPPGHSLFDISLELISPTVMLLGTPEQQQRYVPSFRRGDEVCCQIFSEPGAGSDLGSIATRAVRDGDEWVIDGQKVWTSGARHADFGYLLCRTGTVEEQHRGLTAFIVPMNTPGIDIRPLRQMSGGAEFNEIFLTGARVADANRLGEIGGGWQVALTTLGFERAAAANTEATRAAFFPRLVMLARRVGRDDDPIIRQGLARVYIEEEVQRLTRRRAAEGWRTTGRPGPEGSIGKLAWTDALQDIGDLAAALLGAALTADTGEWGTFRWAEFLTGTQGLRIGGGTDAVQRNTIGERVLGLPREPRLGG